MKNNILIIAITIVLFSQVWLFIKVYQTDNRVAYIDTGKLLEGSKQMQLLKVQLKAEQEKAKGNIDTLTIEFQKSLQDFERNMLKMSATEKKLTQELLRNKQNNLIQYQQAIEQKFGDQEQKKTQEILTVINSSISDYGKKNNYTIIFATTGGNIAYGNEAINITEDIIKIINKE